MLKPTGGWWRSRRQLARKAYLQQSSESPAEWVYEASPLPLEKPLDHI